MASKDAEIFAEDENFVGHLKKEREGGNDGTPHTWACDVKYMVILSRSKDSPGIDDPEIQGKQSWHFSSYQRFGIISVFYPPPKKSNYAYLPKYLVVEKIVSSKDLFTAEFTKDLGCG